MNVGRGVDLRHQLCACVYASFGFLSTRKGIWNRPRRCVFHQQECPPETDCIQFHSGFLLRTMAIWSRLTLFSIRSFYQEGCQVWVTECVSLLSYPQCRSENRVNMFLISLRSTMWIGKPTENVSHCFPIHNVDPNPAQYVSHCFPIHNVDPNPAQYVSHCFPIRNVDWKTN